MTISIWFMLIASVLGDWELHDDTPVEVRVGKIFSQSCVSCHNSTDQAGGLSLETVVDLRTGGYLAAEAEVAPLLSVLIAVNGEPPAMPKDGHPLTEEELAVVREWLLAGSPWGIDQRVKIAIVEDYSWWSREPLREVQLPDLQSLSKLSRLVSHSGSEDVSPESWVKNPIDRFVWREFERRGLAPNPPADRRTMIRRLCYDLTGLPPSAAEILSFENDQRPDAYEQFVDRLLASPRYGERWARHWLDIARYADTTGYDKDKLRPHAWPYRDYVIRSFNEDKRYSRFVEEQIAGDVLFPDSPDGILGLGFLAAGPWDFIGHVEVSESKFDGMEARNLDRDEMVSATMNVFCSTTVQCARCHHHKFDPITLAQYYGMQAVFAAVDRANRSFDVDPTVAAKRAQIAAELKKASSQILEIEAAMDAEGGARLRELREQVQALAGATKVSTPAVWPDAYGYHSQLSDSQNEEKWIEFHFDEPIQVQRIVFYPCHDEFGGIGAGFGFPDQLSVSYREHESDAWRVAASENTTKENRSKNSPFEIEYAERTFLAESIRISTNQLAWRQDAWIMALAEVEIWTAGKENVAPRAKVNAKDSIEAEPRWRLTNLTDGLWPQYSRQNATEQLAATNQLQELEAELTTLEATLRTPTRLASLLPLQQEKARLEREAANLPPASQVFAAATNFSSEGNFKATQGVPRRVRVLHRGSVSLPQEDAVPGTIPLASDSPYQFVDEKNMADEGRRREQLARWITSPDNPLTWRSIVNRIWLGHFGRALVDSPNDFGRMGQLPTHPELLDWLAVEFRSRQSFKSLSRMIVISATYRQASQDHEEFAKVDADNSGYWKFNRRRLSAEEVRDSMLMVAGCLDETMGGPGYYLFELDRPEHSPHYEYRKFNPDNPATHRRSIYRFVVRSQPDPWITTMDGADCSQSVAKRDETITPMQALSLLNNDFTLVVARRMAERLAREHSERDVQIRTGFELVSGRAPTEAEFGHLSLYAKEHGMTNLCRVLVNLSEFVFVD
ncbi:MAG: DUF1553 domain-containing protein [Pirellulaceae bacterium]|nr:DUF1553 domain-containing protein [Pirellulaceae bacterium]